MLGNIHLLYVFNRNPAYSYYLPSYIVASSQLKKRVPEKHLPYILVYETGL